MKTLATITFAALSFAALPVNAALQDAKPETAGQIVPERLAMKQSPPEAAECGEAKDMIIIVRDDHGAVVAIGRARVAPAC